MILLLALGLGAVLGLTHLGSHAGNKPDQPTPSLATSGQVPAAVSPERTPPTSRLNRQDIPMEGKSSPQLVSILLAGADGATIEDALVVWNPEGAAIDEGVLAEYQGTNRYVFTPNGSAGEVSVKAPGYRPASLYWRLGDSDDLEVALEALSTIRAIRCLQEDTGLPLEGVQVVLGQHLDDARETARHRIWRSDSQGILRLPAEEGQPLPFTVTGTADGGIQRAFYELYPEDEEIPIYRKSLLSVQVTREQGGGIAKMAVGSAPSALSFGQENASTVAFSWEKATTDAEGKAMLDLPRNVSQTVWAEVPDSGRYQKLVLPQSDFVELTFTAFPQQALLVEVQLPQGIAPEGMELVAMRKDEETTIPRDPQGLFEVPTPALYDRLRLTAPGCQTVEGFLSLVGVETPGIPSPAGGYILLRLQEGFEVHGVALRPDGAPAQTTVTLFPINLRSAAVVVERQGASRWNWEMAPSPLTVATAKDGSFRFEHVPTGTYLLDEILPSGELAMEHGVCSFTQETRVLKLDGPRRDWQCILPLYTKVRIEVMDADSQRPLPHFLLLRDIPSDGVAGEPGVGEQGIFRGWLALADLPKILLTAKGYLPTRLTADQFSQDGGVRQARIRLHPIQPGTIQFAVPGDGLLLKQVILFVEEAGKETAPSDGTLPQWHTTLVLTPGQPQTFAPSRPAKLRLRFQLRDPALRETYRLVPEEVDYLPGQELSLELHALAPATSHQSTSSQ